MHAPIEHALIARADAAVREARRLCAELEQHVAIAEAICRRASQSELFQSGLASGLAISLLEENGWNARP
jgi:hypothetical protein